jgi:hypothetical protein|tara:strand:- start:2093 stop:2563 length:471 start_codon:yes stop_codon:yes gene_type:complete
MTVITGKAYWASVVSPNKTFDVDGTWTLDVCNLDKKNIEMVKADGLTIKNKGDDRGDFVTIKRKVKRKDGNENAAPIVVDAQKRPLALDILIGNGSLVNVLYSTYDWEFKGRKGTSADLKSVQVTDLVPYESGPKEDFDVVKDGYTSNEETSAAFA